MDREGRSPNTCNNDTWKSLKAGPSDHLRATVHLLYMCLNIGIPLEIGTTLERQANVLCPRDVHLGGSMVRDGRSPNSFNNGKSESFKAGPFRAPKTDCAFGVIFVGSTDGLRDS